MIPNIHKLFIESVQKNAQKTAIIFNSKSYTYAQLNERDNEFANALIEKNYPKNSVIGISVKRSFDLMSLFNFAFSYFSDSCMANLSEYLTYPIGIFGP
jgi:acyl-CoA synthetase (AMP-forming)/AMP-acid ligase II